MLAAVVEEGGVGGGRGNSGGGAGGSATVALVVMAMEVVAGLTKTIRMAAAEKVLMIVCACRRTHARTHDGKHAYLPMRLREARCADGNELRVACEDKCEDERAR